MDWAVWGTQQYTLSDWYCSHHPQELNLCRGLCSESVDDPRPLGERVWRPLDREERLGMVADSPGDASPVPLEPELSGLAPGRVGEVGDSRPLTPSPAAV